MCTLNSIRKTQDEMRRAFEVANERDELGNYEPQYAVFPDHVAPVVTQGAHGRVLTKMRWGHPPLGPKAAPVMNVRNTEKGFWRGKLEPEYRCPVPATSFCEYADTKPRKTPVWFALSEERPLYAFAGIWRPWTGVRGTKAENPDREAAEHRLFAFLTCDANEVVEPVHGKAMPVPLTTAEEWRTWLEAPTKDALRLQRPLPDAEMKEVARGERRDGQSSPWPTHRAKSCPADFICAIAGRDQADGDQTPRMESCSFYQVNEGLISMFTRSFKKFDYVMANPSDRSVKRVVFHVRHDRTLQADIDVLIRHADELLLP